MRCAALRCDAMVSQIVRASASAWLFFISPSVRLLIFSFRVASAYFPISFARCTRCGRGMWARELCPGPGPACSGIHHCQTEAAEAGHHRHHDQHHHHPVRAIWPFEKATFQPYFFLLSIWRCQLWSFFIGLLMRNPPMLPPSSSFPAPSCTKLERIKRVRVGIGIGFGRRCCLWAIWSQV